MASLTDLFNKAAQCERLMEQEHDEIRHAAYRLLRDMWIALAHQRPLLSPEDLAREVAAIEEIQSGFLRANKLAS